MSLISKFDGNMNIVGKYIKEYRVQKGLSYEQLAAKLELLGINIHKQSLYDIEHNKRTVKDYELLGIAYLLNINVNNLFENIRKQLEL